jgi:hypothetical protein
MRDGLSFSRSLVALSLKCAVCCGMLVTPSLLFAQERGKVEVDKDPKVDSLIENYLVDKKTGNVSANATPGKTVSVSTDGYRVQIYSGAERKAAFDAQARFQDKFPDQRTYVSYREPNFRVHVGDFRTRLEAEKLMQELRPWFPGLFIIPEKINAKISTE